MPATALALALAAAALHAGWNILIARAGDPEGAGAAAILIGVVAFAPVAALTWQVEWAAVPYIGASAAFELAYFALLAAAYRRYDLSVVYPIARGAAPVLVLVFAVVATSAQASALEVVGVAIVAVGIMLVRGVHVGGRLGGAGDGARRGSVHRRVHGDRQVRAPPRGGDPVPRDDARDRGHRLRDRPLGARGAPGREERVLALDRGSRRRDVPRLRARARCASAGARRLGRGGARDERRHGDGHGRGRPPRARLAGRATGAVLVAVGRRGARARMTAAAVTILAYALGCVATGYYIVRLVTGEDLRGM